jgi:hypothetical protein
MASAAQQVIAAQAQLLIDAATSAAERVWTDRLWPVGSADLPCFKVVHVDEQFKTETVHWPPLQLHTLKSLVIGEARAVTGMDAALDALKVQALSALFGTLERATLSSLGAGKVQQIPTSIATRLPTEKDTGPADTGMVLIEVTSQFRTHVNAPETLV